MTDKEKLHCPKCRSTLLTYKLTKDGYFIICLRCPYKEKVDTWKEEL
jgi:DNA-directed RNA polymerase subunit M/transcription elongation factor TFIIS